MSLNTSQDVDGIASQNEDILSFNGSGFSMYFDGSDVGLSGLSISAFTFLSDNEILMSFTTSSSALGIGTVDDSDIVKFTATSLGPNTSGSFELYFDGSDVGLSTSSEDIDALSILPNHNLLISTTGSASVGNIRANDEDLLEFLPVITGSTTVGAWSFYFDGSDVGLSSSGEDLDGAVADADGNLYLSTISNFSVSGLSGSDEDIFKFVPTSLGTSTSGSFVSPLIFDGSAYGFSSNDLKAFALP
jgi:hypothetical protein